MSDTGTGEIDFSTICGAVIIVFVGFAFIFAVTAPVFTGLFAVDLNGDGEYDYTQYEINGSENSEYVERTTIQRHSSLTVEFGDYRGTVPDKVTLYQDDRKIDTDYIHDSERGSYLSLSDATSGNVTVVFTSESGGGLGGSPEQTVLDRHEITLTTTQETTECSGRFICSRLSES